MTKSGCLSLRRTPALTQVFGDWFQIFVQLGEEFEPSFIPGHSFLEHPQVVLELLDYHKGQETIQTRQTPGSNTFLDDAGKQVYCYNLYGTGTNVHSYSIVLYIFHIY